MVHKKTRSKVAWGGRIITRVGEIVDIPPYIAVIDKDTLKVRTSDWAGSHIMTIKRSDWYKTERGSGLASIGGISGDWRMIQNLTEDLKYIFDKLEETD